MAADSPRHPDDPSTLSWPRWDLGLPEGLQPPTQPDRYMLWLARRQWRSIAAGAVFGSLWMLPVALIPAVIGQAIDRGVVLRDGRELLLWSAAALGLGLVAAAAGNARHLAAVSNWLLASFRTSILAERQLRAAGPALTRSLPTGEVVASFADDFGRIGGAYDVTARLTGALVSFGVVAVILLRGSTLLGLVMLVGGPLLVLSLSLVVRPLQRRQEAQRAASGRLTTLAADTVAGLRVLRGVGGERTFLDRYAAQSAHVRAAGVRISALQATLDAAQVLLPGIFVLIVTALGARLVVAGEISPGELVAYYGYTTFLVMPLRTVVEFVEAYTRSRVAVSKIMRFFAVKPDHSPGGEPLSEDTRAAELVDAASGVRVAPGLLTALVSADPDDSALVCRRLGRVGPDRGADGAGVRWGGADLARADIGSVRRDIVVSESLPHLFSGPVGAGLSVRGDDLSAALWAGDADDAIDAIEGGIDGVLHERGRTLSGGQRQRLGLVRALAADPEVLILIEPTSAVDAHTEARVAQRIGDLRQGSTTVVATVSPLWLHRADVVHLLVDGRVVASGTHDELVRGTTAYRSVVHRGEDE